MATMSELYQSVILDHNRSPRNFRRMEGADRKALGNNPLCGDELTVWLKLGAEGTIEDVSFLGSGCAISKASASMMTAAVKGRRREEVLALRPVRAPGRIGSEHPEQRRSEVDVGDLAVHRLPLRDPRPANDQRHPQ